MAADVCRVLELGWDKTNQTYAPSKATRLLDSSEKGRKKIPTSNQELLIISESGLYKLIMRSNKPQAKPFQNWVTQVVLPAIRKDGMYVAGEE